MESDGAFGYHGALGVRNSTTADSPSAAKICSARFTIEAAKTPGDGQGIAARMVAYAFASF